MLRLKAVYNPSKPYKNKILAEIAKTWKTPYLSVIKDIYPVFFRKISYPEVDHTDGIGTKGVFHWEKRSFKAAVLDALAMNLNDLALVRATPYKLQNHIILPQDDQSAILAIIKALGQECKKRKIAITGGETSIHNNIAGLDIGMTVSGFIKKQKPNRLQIGDVLIGLGSSGIHSNGLTKARLVLGESFRPDFVKPTHIYSDSILKLNGMVDIHGMMHITGGAFTKLKDILPSGADIVIHKNHKLKPQKIFQGLSRLGVPDQEMYQTFNCGIGFILSIGKKDVAETLKFLSKYHKADIIGEVVRGGRYIKIESMFSERLLEY